MDTYRVLEWNERDRTTPEVQSTETPKPVEAAPAPAEGAPKELTKSQLKKLAKQKNAKPKMSKEEKMKAVVRWITMVMDSGA